VTWRVLIVGLGQIGMGYDLAQCPTLLAVTHARGFSRHDAFDLVGGVDPSGERRALFEKHYGAPTFSEAAAAVKSLAPDVVVVAVPTEQHCASVREVLAAGRPKAILCEKPLAYDLVEAREIVELCAGHDCALFVNYMRRADRGVSEVKRRLAAGSISAPEKAVVWYSKGLFNNGSHLVDLLKDWLGEVISFEMIAAGRLWNGGDPEPDVVLTFAQGTKAYFLAAREEMFSHYTVELIAGNGRLRYERGGEEILWQKTIADPAMAGYTVLDPVAEVIPNDLAQAQWHVADQLAECLDGRTGCICTGAEALRTLETLVAIKEQR
jgi:predicted dehydrogenase